MKNLEIIETAKDIIAEEYDIVKEKISNDISFRDRLLKFDTLAKYELMMAMEKHYNVSIEYTETAQFEHAKTLSEFCDLFSNYVYPNTEKTAKDYSNSSKEDIFNVIYKHLYETYTISFTKPTSNWYVDLGLNDFELSNFYTWAEKEFNIKMPFFYFTDINTLCNIIFITIKKQNLKKRMLDKIYTSLYQYKFFQKNKRVK